MSIEHLDRLEECLWSEIAWQEPREQKDTLRHKDDKKVGFVGEVEFR